MSNSSLDVHAYHQRTKHQLNAYAKGPQSLDWDDQPNAFRRFNGCELTPLPKPGKQLPVLYSQLDYPENIANAELNLVNLGLLLELSFGLSAWKQLGPDRWALRCNPSSGNLHPTEVYLIATDDCVLAPGVYHYVSYDHHLENRCRLIGDNNLEPAIYFGLSSVHWREAWKYGERAFRYCQHDTGHALAALSYAAACLGWRIELCSEISDADLAACLGLNRQEDFMADEREYPDLLCRLQVNTQQNLPTDLQTLSQILQSANWFGKALSLGSRHFYHWPIIDEVSHSCEKPLTTAERFSHLTLKLPPVSHDQPASVLIKQRRSAQRFLAKSEPLALIDFQRILSALLPNNKPPFTAWNWSAKVHLFLFVHNVEGLQPGLYFLPRAPAAVTELKTALSADYLWQNLEFDFDFYLLMAGRFQSVAKTLSCNQAIAGDSAFSLGMLAQFADNIDASPWHYRQLFWECGLIGQILYLEAEAAGVRGTGIGCFFDDAVHGVLGLQDNAWQSLYHFTVGTPLVDNRLQSFPAYEHLIIKD